LRVYPSGWENAIKHGLSNYLPSGPNNATRLASVIDGGRLINSNPSRSHHDLEKSGMVQSGVSATVQRFNLDGDVSHYFVATIAYVQNIEK